MTYHYKKTSNAGLAALAVGATLAFAPLKADALTVSSSGVTGGCATTPTTNFEGIIDVLNGGSWEATFIDGDTERGCFFDLENNAGSDTAVTIAVATVNQGLTSFGFREGVNHDGGVEFKTNNSSLWSVAEGVADSQSFNFNIAANDSVFFDVFWGDAYTSGGAQPKINFNVSAVATPVPLPAAGWLMLAGFGGLAALRRRKRAA